MSTVDEKRRALEYTEKFLMDLLNPKETPKVPKWVRKWAGMMLRHYPSKGEIARLRGFYGELE